MKVVHYDKPGPPEVLKIIERNVPKFNDHEILINVKCAGVNRPDLIQREEIIHLLLNIRIYLVLKFLE